MVSSISHRSLPVSKEKIRVGLIGVGNFAKSTHIPNLKSLSAKFEIAAVCANSSASAESIGRQLGASLSATDFKRVIGDSSIDAVVISTRHDKHASMASEALKAGKHVFLEKPLALFMEELGALEETIGSLRPAPVLMVGFNRRYSPAAQQLKKALSERKSPLMALYRVNAGALPLGHWGNSEEGGGRLRGEACHMLDFFQSLIGSPLQSFSAAALSPTNTARSDENFSVQLGYSDGSVATLVYTSVGNSALPKEKVEVHWGGKSATIDDFRSLTVAGASQFKYSGPSDKGHKNALQVFYDAIKSGNSFPTPWEHLVETTRACIELDREVWGKPSDLCAE